MNFVRPFLKPSAPFVRLERKEDNKNDEKQSKVQEMEIDTGADQVVFGIEERGNVSTR